MLNLWPDTKGTTELMPSDILQSQAMVMLGQLGTHQREDNGSDCYVRIYNDIAGRLELVIKSNNGVVAILNISHADSYPCKLWFDGKCSKVRTSAELIGKLAWAFNHDKTRQVIAELMK